MPEKLQQLQNKVAELEREQADLRSILFKKTGSGPSDIKNREIGVDNLKRANTNETWITVKDDIFIQGNHIINFGSEDARITRLAADELAVNEKLIVGGGDIVRPGEDGTITLGTSTKRWSDVRSVLINGADYCFDNGWTLTENDKVGVKEPGIALLDRENNLVLFVGQDGIYAPNLRNIKGLSWKKTTQEERKKMVTKK